MPCDALCYVIYCNCTSRHFNYVNFNLILLSPTYNFNYILSTNTSSPSHNPQVPVHLCHYFEEPSQLIVAHPCVLQHFAGVHVDVVSDKLGGGECWHNGSGPSSPTY